MSKEMQKRGFMDLPNYIGIKVRNHELPDGDWWLQPEFFWVTKRPPWSQEEPSLEKGDEWVLAVTVHLPGLPNYKPDFNLDALAIRFDPDVDVMVKRVDAAIEAIVRIVTGALTQSKPDPESHPQTECRPMRTCRS